MGPDPSAGVYSWRLYAEALRDDPSTVYRMTKAAAGVCSACDCEEPALVLVTTPHARHGTWERGLCVDHLTAFRR